MKRPECPHVCTVCGRHLTYCGLGARGTGEPESARRLLYHCDDHPFEGADYEPARDRWIVATS